jgi:hypothetical protein
VLYPDVGTVGDDTVNIESWGVEVFKCPYLHLFIVGMDIVEQGVPDAMIMEVEGADITVFLVGETANVIAINDKWQQGKFAKKQFLQAYARV